MRKKDTGIVWALKSMTKDAMVIKNQASLSVMIVLRCMTKSARPHGCCRALVDPRGSEKRGLDS